MHKTRKWLNSWPGTLIGLTAGLWFLAAVTVGHAATQANKPGQPVQLTIQGQQLCPGTPGAGPCKILIDCPSLKTPGKTVSQATIDCPPQQATKPQKKTESGPKTK
jgi:hypothetical protein